MADVIENGALVADTYVLFESTLPAGGDLLVPLQAWLADGSAFDTYRARAKGKIGVVLLPDADPAVLKDAFDRLDLIAITFEKFADGRGFSQAYLLRKRYGYSGTLRAIGLLLRDQLFYLTRVGFDSVTLRAGQDPQAALQSLNDFSVRYQGSVDEPLPLFARQSQGAVNV
jgi:uncharacterized protein (DUF934 family)